MKPWGWTAQQTELLKTRYAEANNKKLAAEIGVPPRALVNKASALGLQKSSRGLSACRAQPGSRQGHITQLLMAACERGLRATDIAQLLGTQADAVQKAMANMKKARLAWIVRGRRGESRWFGTQAWAAAFASARAALPSCAPQPAWPAPPAPAHARPKPAPVPLNLTQRTRHVVAPPPPERFGGAPVERSFSSLRPGEYLPLAASGWVDAITRPR